MLFWHNSMLSSAFYCFPTGSISPPTVLVLRCDSISLPAQGVSNSICDTLGDSSPAAFLWKCQTCNRKKGVEDRKVPFPLCCQVECDSLLSLGGCQAWVTADKQSSQQHGTLKKTRWSLWTHLHQRCGAFMAAADMGLWIITWKKWQLNLLHSLCGLHTTWNWF